MANSIKHKFASGVADGGDATKVRPSNWNSELTAPAGKTDGMALLFKDAESDKMEWKFLESIFHTFTNTSGSGVALGDVCIQDVAADNSFKKASALQSTLQVAIAQESIANSAAGRFKLSGVSTVAVDGAVTRGNYLIVDDTAGFARDGGAVAVDGAFAVAVTGFAGPGTGTVTAVLFGTTLQVKSLVTYAVRGLRGDFNTVAIFDVNADSVVLRDVNNRALVKHNPGAEAVNITTSGINGRDQVAAFSANTFIYVYYIGKTDGTVDLVASATPPPTGPDLSTIAALQAYAYWAFAGVLRVDGSVNIVRCRWRGPWLTWEPSILVLDEGTATTETAVATSSAVPTVAGEVKFRLNGVGPTAANANALRLRVTTGVECIVRQSRSADEPIIETILLPNVGQNVYYLGTGAGFGPLDIFVDGFAMPNNG